MAPRASGHGGGASGPGERSAACMPITPAAGQRRSPGGADVELRRLSTPRRAGGAAAAARASRSCPPARSRTPTSGRPAAAPHRRRAVHAGQARLRRRRSPGSPSPAFTPAANAGTRHARYAVSGSRRRGQTSRERARPGRVVEHLAPGPVPLEGPGSAHAPTPTTARGRAARRRLAPVRRSRAPAADRSPGDRAGPRHARRTTTSTSQGRSRSPVRGAAGVNSHGSSARANSIAPCSRPRSSWCRAAAPSRTIWPRSSPVMSPGP